MLTVLVIMGIAGFAVALVRQDTAQRDALNARIDARAATSARFISAYVGSVFDRETQLAGASLAGRVDAPLFTRVSAENGYSAAVLVDDAGRLVAVAPHRPDLIGSAIAGRYAHLTAALRGQPTVSDVVPSAARAQPVVAFAVPYTTPAGRRVFSGAYDLSATPLAPFLSNVLSFRTAATYLTDSRGTLLAASDAALAGKSMIEAAPPVAAVFRSGAHGFYRAGGQRRYYVTTAVTGTGWTLTFTLSTAEEFAPVSGPRRALPWVALAGFAVAAMSVLALLHRAQQQRHLLAVAESERRAIIDTAPVAFVAMDDTGAVIDWNGAATDLLGWPAQEAIGRPLDQLIVPPERRAEHTQAVQRFLATGARALPDTPVELAARHRDGRDVTVELSVTRLSTPTGWRFHGFLRDITGRIAFETQLRGLALSDPLTGLANRRASSERLTQALARARRTGETVAVVYIDVDHFKVINDTHGHAVGDAVLTGVAQRLRETFRVEDTIARLGGDEFAVICEHLADPSAAQILVDRVRLALIQPYPAGDLRIHASASVGYALSGGDETDEQVYARADAAMYVAKGSRVAWLALTQQLADDQ